MRMTLKKEKSLQMMSQFHSTVVLLRVQSILSILVRASRGQVATRPQTQRDGINQRTFVCCPHERSDVRTSQGLTQLKFRPSTQVFKSRHQSVLQPICRILPSQLAADSTLLTTLSTGCQSQNSQSDNSLVNCVNETCV
jgi:hypothetical protein